MAAKVFGKNNGGPGIRLTLGCRGENWPYNGSIDAATSFGNELVEANLDQVVIDEANRIVTAPAYMKGDATPSQVFSNVSKLVDTVAKKIQNETKSHPVTLVVNVEIQEDKLEEFRKVITADAEQSRLEPGCYRFDVLEDPDNKTRFTFYESYKDLEAVEYHCQQPHFMAWKAFADAGHGKVVSKQVLNASDYTF